MPGSRLSENLATVVQVEMEETENGTREHILVVKILQERNGEREEPLVDEEHIIEEREERTLGPVLL